MSNNVISFKAATTLAAQRIVAITGENLVGYPADNQTMPIGVTLDQNKDTVSGIPVQINGRAKLKFADTVSTAGLVQSNSSGEGVPFTLANTTTALTLASFYVGVLLGPTVTANTVAEILIQPGSSTE